MDETTNATAEIAVITNDTTAIGGLEISTLMGLLDQLEPLATGSASVSVYKQVNRTAKGSLSE